MEKPNMNWWQNIILGFITYLVIGAIAARFEYQHMLKQWKNDSDSSWDPLESARWMFFFWPLALIVRGCETIFQVFRFLFRHAIGYKPLPIRPQTPVQETENRAPTRREVRRAKRALTNTIRDMTRNNDG